MIEALQEVECRKCHCIWEREFADKFNIMMVLKRCPMCNMDGEE